MDPITLASAIFSASQVAKPLAEKGAKLIDSLLGEPCRVAGNLLADQIYYWQWLNRVKIAARAKEIMDQNGVAARVVPKGFLLPLVDEAGNVEEPQLQELFAQLMANGVADDAAQRRQFVGTLKLLSADDARFFLDLAAKGERDWYRFSGQDSAEDERAGRLSSLGLLEPVVWAQLEKNVNATTFFAAGGNISAQVATPRFESPREFAVRLFRPGAKVTLFGFQFFNAISPRCKSEVGR